MMPGPQGGMSGSMPSSMSGSMPISHGGMTDIFGMHPHQPPGSDMDAHELSSAETSMGRKSKRRNRRRRFKRTHSLMSCSSDGRSRPSRHDSDSKENTSMEGDKATGEGHVMNTRLQQSTDKGVAGEGALTRTTGTRENVMAPVTTVPTAVTQGVS